MSAFLDSVLRAGEVLQSLAPLEPAVLEAARRCATAIQSGNKIMICGNGGSAAEAQHLAGELAGRYLKDRRALPALALSADGAVMTCIGNDYEFREVFARQVEGLGKPGDVLIAFSTSGRSPNVLRALEAAGERGLRTIAFLGSGGPAASLAELSLCVDSTETARTQEAHQFLMHCFMDALEATLTSSGKAGLSGDHDA